MSASRGRWIDGTAGGGQAGDRPAGRSGRPARSRPEPRRRRRLLLGGALLLAGLSPALAGFDLLRSENGDVNDGNALLADGKPDEALEAYARAAARHPTEPILALDRGLAFYAKKDWARARDEFLRATAAASSAVRSDAFFALGNAHFQLEEWEKAIEAYKRALLVDHAARDAKWNLELALRRLEEKKKKDEEEKPPESSPESSPESAPESRPESEPAPPESGPSEPKPDEAGAPESKPAEPKPGEESPESSPAAGPPPMPEGLDPSTVLDALKDDEKAIKKADRMKALGIPPRSVEKDW